MKLLPLLLLLAVVGCEQRSTDAVIGKTCVRKKIADVDCIYCTRHVYLGESVAVSCNWKETAK
jgi:hypothetical protein